MSEEIYLVLKWEDIDRFLPPLDKEYIRTLNKTIIESKQRHGKPQNQYLVLNLDDDISPNYLYHRMIEYERKRAPIFKIKDIAVDLINAILKAKGD